jgi:hypothetical protein
MLSVCAVMMIFKFFEKLFAMACTSKYNKHVLFAAMKTY